MSKKLRRETTLSLRKKKLPGYVCAVYSQILQVREAKESVLIYRLQIIGCEETLKRDTILQFMAPSLINNKTSWHIFLKMGPIS